MKNSLSQMKKTLRDNPWVQSPQWEAVRNLLEQLNFGETYYPRGSKQASKDLDKTITHHRQWVRALVNLDSFQHSYLINGATEGINQWRMTDLRDWQFLQGDYNWPQLISGNGQQTDINHLSSEKVLYISNPSAIDGNFLNQNTIDKINAAQCPVILDCAYVGSTTLQQVPIFENTEQVLFSFSKGWGLIGQRAGLLYTKQPHPTLKHMRRVECWNYQTTELILAIMLQFNADSMHKLSFATQNKICKQFDLTPSHSYFLANSTDTYFEKQMRSKNLARLCITPAWESFHNSLNSSK